MVYLCSNCKAIYDGEKLNDEKKLCPNMSCQEYPYELIELDEEMSFIVKTCIERNITTLYCCSGHIQPSIKGKGLVNFSGTYLMFDGHIKNKMSLILNNNDMKSIIIEEDEFDNLKRTTVRSIDQKDLTYPEYLLERNKVFLVLYKIATSI